jgi:CRP-like cAMP-binding protein
MADLLEELDGFDIQSFNAGETLLRAGEPGKALYVLIDGEVEVSRGGTKAVNLKQPGTVIGELSGLLNITRTANVTAVTPTRCYLIEDMHTVFKENVEVAIGVSQVEFARLNTMVSMILQIQEQYFEAAEAIKLDLSEIPGMSNYIRYCEEVQASSASKYPFILKSIFDLGDEVTIASGETLFQDGKVTEPFYALKQGELRMSMFAGMINFPITEQGTVLNVGSALMPAPSIFSISAVEDSVVIKVDDIRQLFGTEQEAGYELLRQVAQRIVDFTATFVEIKAKILNLHAVIDAKYKDKVEQLVDVMHQQERNLQIALLN